MYISIARIYYSSLFRGNVSSLRPGASLGLFYWGRGESQFADRTLSKILGPTKMRLSFFLYKFCQKVDPLKIFAAKSPFIYGPGYDVLLHRHKKSSLLFWTIHQLHKTRGVGDAYTKTGRRQSPDLPIFSDTTNTKHKKTNNFLRPIQ